VGRRLTAVIVLAAACFAALLATVPVSLPYLYNYTVTATDTPQIVITNADVWGSGNQWCPGNIGEPCIPYGPTEYFTLYETTTVTAAPVTYSETEAATATSTGLAPFLEVAANPSLQPYACTHPNLPGAVLFCLTQFWEVVIIPLIAVAGLLVYSLAHRLRKSRPTATKIT